MFEKNKIVQSDPYKKITNKEKPVSNVYWGEVVSNFDISDGGRIKVRIPELDVQTENDNLPDCYPLLPKFLHINPKVGEIVRIVLEDTKFPQRSRFWIGSVISQPQNFNFDDRFTALNTTNLAISAPLDAPSTIPEAVGIYPELEDIALIGRENTDIILRERDLEIRAGKHEFDDNLKLNKTNPASIRLVYEQDTGGTKTISSNIIMGDKIALISHDGIPKFKAAQIDQEERNRIFKQGHPIGRGDAILDALELLRKAIIQHIHPYPGLSSDRSNIILDLEKADFTHILQKNIVIN